MLKSIVFFLSYFFSVICWGATSDQPELRSLGSEAFKQGDYSLAIKYFKKAMAGGDKKFTTRYNLAVSYFKSGQLRSSKEQFSSLLSDGFGAPEVVYSLAVIEKQLGNVSRAITLFTLVEESGSELSENARKQLQPLERNKVEHSNSRRVDGLLSLTYGYNDSLVDVADGEIIRSGDNNTELIATLAWQNPSAGKADWEVQTLLYSSQYFEFDNQDYNLFSVGLGKGFLLSYGKLFGEVNVELSQLNNHGYMRNTLLSVGFQKHRAAKAWQLKYRFKKNTSLNSVYDAFAGDEHRIEVNYRINFSNNKHQWRARGFVGSINRPVLDYMNFKQDLSKSRFRADLSYSTLLRYDIDFILGINFTESHVDNYRRYEIGRNLDRKESTTVYYLNLQKTILDSWLVSANYHYRVNASNLRNFDYKQAVFKFGVSLVF